MRIVKRLTHVLVLVLTLVIGADGGRDHRVADGVVQELAARLHRARGQPVSERHAVDRAPRRQSVLRPRDGKRRRVDGRQPGRGGQGPRPRLQRLPADLERAVGRRNPSGQAGHLPASRRRYLVAQPPDQEAGDTKPTAEGPTYPIAVDAIGITDGSVVVDVAGRHVGRRRCRSASIIWTRSCRSNTSRCATRSRSPTCRSAAPSRRIAVNALSGGVAVRDDTVFVEKLALRTAETSLSVDGAVQQYLTKPILNLRDLVGQTVAAGDRAAGAGAGRRHAAAGVQRESRRAARRAQGRDERAVVRRAS